MQYQWLHHQKHCPVEQCSSLFIYFRILQTLFFYWFNDGSCFTCNLVVFGFDGCRSEFCQRCLVPGYFHYSSWQPSPSHTRRSSLEVVHKPQKYKIAVNHVCNTNCQCYLLQILKYLVSFSPVGCSVKCPNSWLIFWRNRRHYMDNDNNDTSSTSGDIL